MVDCGTQQPEGLIAIAMAHPLTRQVHVHQRYIAQEIAVTRK